MSYLVYIESLLMILCYEELLLLLINYLYITSLCIHLTVTIGKWKTIKLQLFEK